MTKIENDIHEEMKTMIADKTECMIESYGKVLDKTAKMFNEAETQHGINMAMLGSEVAKRADMFWNIALQRIEKDQNKVEQEKQMIKQQQQRSSMIPQQGMPPMDMSQMQRTGETPCAKKARESAEKIATLEAEIVENKEK